MKRLLKYPVAGLLALIARLIVRKYKPKIIMITGSVGKTSTKDAIASALSGLTYVRASEKSYNSEFGVPLTIIGAKNPWTSPVGWASVFGEAVLMLLLPNHYPKILILEVGADSPGDLAKILKIATPDAVVVTRLPEIPVHVEAYASPEAVREEEFVPAYGLDAGAPLVISAHDPYAATYAKRLQASISTFGFEEDATVSIGKDTMHMEDGLPVGIGAPVRVAGVTYEILVRGAVGRPQLLAVAAAIAVCTSLGYSVEDVLKGLASYTPPPGRLRLFKGQHNTVLIDDSYNSSPIAAEEALETLARVPGNRHIAVLGDMLELGRYSMVEHERIGRLAGKHVDYLFTVGVRTRALRDAAVDAGLTNDHATSCASAREVADALLPMLEPGDVVLAKGSQNNIRLERLIEALLADPADVKYLVRQDRQWKKR